jgi:adenylate kinase family enzyme
MERVVIIGCAGTGKSTLARRLGARTGLPVVHLDALFWEPGWRESDPTAFRQRVIEALVGGRWITDGIYNSKTFDLRLPQADLIIWIDQPLGLRLWRVIWRAVRYRGQTRPDLAPDCPERIDLEFLKYIWNFDRKNRPRLEAAIARLAPAAPLVRLRGDGEITRFLEGISARR